MQSIAQGVIHNGKVTASFSEITSGLQFDTREYILGASGKELQLQT
jgi:hypothetical protein